MKIVKAKYLNSVIEEGKLPDYNLPEYAFVGRSNVGKSSLINKLTNQKKLARTSSTPGRTRMLNYFLINDDIIFVDLPGYGYAKASKESQEKWQLAIEHYLKLSQYIKRVFLLVDIRIEPTENDIIMMKYLYFYQIPFTVIATKTDKLSRAQQFRAQSKIASKLGLGAKDIICVSAENGQNIETLLEKIN